MKANELMIGDWVLVNGAPMQIQAIDDIDGEIMAGDGLYCLVEDRVHSEDKVEPIPLTAEILEKNGFSNKYCNEDYDLSYATDFAGDVIGVHINGDGGLMDEMYIKTVHELQHALRLCGIEKAINL